MKRIAVVLMNLGGPNNEEAVQPFLYNLFMDDDIIKLPLKGAVRSRLITFLTTRRAKVVSKKYAQINACPQGCMGPKTCVNRINGVVSTCCSATNPITEMQRRALEKHLNAQNDGNQYQVITAMRYWTPSTDMAIDELLTGDFEEVVLLPLYPQFSYSTTASSLNEWYRRIRARGLENRWKTLLVKDYPEHTKYLQAISQRIDEKLATLPPEILDEVHLLFSAHGTPISFKTAGDPYSDQIRQSMEAVMALRGKDRPYWLSFQSRVGPVQWLKPNTEEFLPVLHGYGVRHIVVVPIAFVGDHIETSMEISIEFKEVADHLGIDTFVCTTGLNDLPLFIESLGDLVREKVQSPAVVSTN